MRLWPYNSINVVCVCVCVCPDQISQHNATVSVAVSRALSIYDFFPIDPLSPYIRSTLEFEFIVIIHLIFLRWAAYTHSATPRLAGKVAVAHYSKSMEINHVTPVSAPVSTERWRRRRRQLDPVSTHTHTHTITPFCTNQTHSCTHTHMWTGQNKKNTRIAAGKQGRRCVLDKLNLMCQLFVDLSPVRRAGRWRMCVCVFRILNGGYLYGKLPARTKRAHTRTHIWFAKKCWCQLQYARASYGIICAANLSPLFRCIWSIAT